MRPFAMKRDSMSKSNNEATKEAVTNEGDAAERQANRLPQVIVPLWTYVRENSFAYHIQALKEEHEAKEVEARRQKLEEEKQKIENHRPAGTTSPSARIDCSGVGLAGYEQLQRPRPEKERYLVVGLSRATNNQTGHLESKETELIIQQEAKTIPGPIKRTEINPTTLAHLKSLEELKKQANIEKAAAKAQRAALRASLLTGARLRNEGKKAIYNNVKMGVKHDGIETYDEEQARLFAEAAIKNSKGSKGSKATVEQLGDGKEQELKPQKKE